MDELPAGAGRRQAAHRSGCGRRARCRVGRLGVRPARGWSWRHAGRHPSSAATPRARRKRWTAAKCPGSSRSLASWRRSPVRRLCSRESCCSGGTRSMDCARESRGSRRGCDRPPGRAAQVDGRTRGVPGGARGGLKLVQAGAASLYCSSVPRATREGDGSPPTPQRRLAELAREIAMRQTGGRPGT